MRKATGVQPPESSSTPDQEKLKGKLPHLPFSALLWHLAQSPDSLPHIQGLSLMFKTGPNVQDGPSCSRQAMRQNHLGFKRGDCL